ncbi:unnamed protein product [Adineta steineri]|uniref:Uncharacterized protein n=1 Tax=Adineta steineri TaxID=433720 RepID=A0A815KAU0_9BILA|nr:unnamed protein product [Adineta steineri]
MYYNASDQKFLFIRRYSYICLIFLFEDLHVWTRFSSKDLDPLGFHFRSKIFIYLDFTFGQRYSFIWISFFAQRYSSTWILLLLKEIHPLGKISLLLKDIHSLGFHCWSKIFILLDFTVGQRYSFSWISLLLKDIHSLGFHCCSKIFIHLVGYTF